MSFDGGVHHQQGETYLLSWQVAELFGVNSKTIARWAKTGKLPHLRTFGGHRRFPLSKLQALVDELSQEVTAEQ